MSSFPANYVYNNGVTDVMYFPGITEMAMQFGTLGFSPYQSAIATVGQIALVNSATATIRNTAQGELIASKTPDHNFPTQLSYTTKIEDMKDCFKIKLYSPSVNRQDLLSGPGSNDNKVDKGDEAAWKKVKELLPDALGEFGDYLSQAASDVNMMDALENGIDGQKAFYEIETKPSTDLSRSDVTFSGYKYTEIILPMPLEQIVDQHSHALGFAPLSPIMIGLATAGNFLGALGKLRDPRPDQVRSPKDLRPFNPYNTNTREYAQNVASAKIRTTLNPINELLYQSPIPRTWTYTFSYVPTNKKNSDSFLNIIEKLKQHSYPTLSGKEFFYHFPGTCDFKFVVNEEENPNLPHNIRPCFISDIQVSYLNGTTTYTHFTDGNPTSIVLTLTIAETQLLTREDFYPPKILNGILFPPVDDNFVGPPAPPGLK